MYTKLADKKWLESEYVDKLRTLQSIADEVGCCKTQVSRALKRANIGSRKHTSRYPQINDKEWLRKVYIEDERSMNNIAKEIGCAVGVLRDALKAMGIQTRNDKQVYAMQYRDKPRLGSLAPNWNGGRRISGAGYVYIYKPEHPFADKRGTVFEHRLVMEEYLGRYLNCEEVGHHKDGNKENNAIENLEVLTKGEHLALHFLNSHEVPKLRKRIEILEEEIEQLKKH